MISRRGRAVGTVTAGPACWCRRRNAVLRQALLQYACRPVGVNNRWQTGHVIVPGSSRDGIPDGMFKGGSTVEE